MLELNKNDRPDLLFLQLDACDMKSFSDEEFSVIIDKATLDAVLVDETSEVNEYVQKYWSEIDRVLRVGGRYLCISLLQQHVLEALLAKFAQNNYMFRVVRCIEVDERTSNEQNDGSSLPVFMVIATKFKKLPIKVLEVCMGGDKMIRLNKMNDVVESVLSVQRAALVCNGLQRASIAEMNEVSIDLFHPTNPDKPRYTVHVVDQSPSRGNGRYAAFIVPQGRETEWLFSTQEGRKKLLSSAKHDRLAIVSMHRDQNYNSWDDVKHEISASIKNLAPSNVKNQQIPYLSLGHDVGKREIIYKGKSQLSGDFIVEEVSGQDNKTFRRLVFLSNQFVIQSEALLKTGKFKVKLNLNFILTQCLLFCLLAKGKDKKVIEKTIDPTYLACQHHLFMSVGVNFLKAFSTTKQKKNTNVAIIGLGGGGLCTFIHKILK